MSMKSLEAEILRELRTVAGNQKLRQKDITEWSTGDVHPQEGETRYYLPVLKVSVCVKVSP